MKEKEEWKDVVGFENYFMVSNYGSIYSKRTDKILKPTITATGYLTICTKIGGRLGINITKRVHRLVAEAFIPAIKDKIYVNHIDGDKKNNYYKNLEWVTASENSQHAHDNGMIATARGTDSVISKLTESQVKYIRKSKETDRALGKLFGVSHSTISRCRRGERYKNTV